MKTPTASAKRLAIILGLAAYAFVIFAAAALLLVIGNYDRRISGKLARMDGKVTYAQVCAVMKEGRKFRYDGTTHYYPQAPAVTEARGAGDCKDLALWLAAKLNDPSVLFVKGYINDGTAKGHAWLEWFGEGQLWILDLAGGLPPMPSSQPDVPTSSRYYVPEQIITRYGVFDTKSSFSDCWTLKFNRL